MEYQSIFKRYEIKFLLDETAYSKLMQFISSKITLDRFGKTLIRNVYLDTPNYTLIRRSIEKPSYKEKLRIRSYGEPKENEKRFVELKKKCEQVVYKRRFEMSEAKTSSAIWKVKNGLAFPQTQTGKEIAFAFERYQKIQPKIFISYEREAYFLNEDENFRLTFDKNIRWRNECLSIAETANTIPVLGDDMVLLELKTEKAIPLWLAKFLSENHIFKTSFSKYGEAYTAMIKLGKGERNYA